jgi:ParB family chromosome partitioning protein
MTSSRLLIVEPDHAFGLSLAALFQEECITRVARNAAEAELEIAARRPDLVLLRAELPDLSGFSLCARLRNHRATERLPVILYSSETPPASLAEHARTPWAANGYLAMPLDTTALRALSRRILATTAVVESADDAVIEEEPPPAPAPATAPAPPAIPPPPVPRRPVRNALTEEDRLLVDRIFQSIADRRDALILEAHRNRPPPRRDLLQTADGRLQLLRDDLKAREAQIAQLAELWEIREREVAYAGEWLHEKDVELQGLKGEIEDLHGRLVESRELLARREREHGASVDGLLLEKVSQEKELIEAVAGNERRLHEAQRELRARDEQLARRAEELRAAGEALEQARRDAERSRIEAARELEAERDRGEERRATLEAELAAERERAAAAESQLADARGEAEAEGAEAARALEALQGDVGDRDRLLEVARRENDRLQRELTSARHERMVGESEARAEADRASARAEELAALLAEAQRERDEARGALPRSSPPGEEPEAERPDPADSAAPPGGP